MVMMKCPECGKEISDLASSCPHCGFPLGFESSSVNEQKQQYQRTLKTQYYQTKQTTVQQKRDDEKTRNSSLGIWALVFSILGCTFWIGIILSAVDLYRKDGKKKTCSVIALCIGVLWIIIALMAPATNEESGKKTDLEEVDSKSEALLVKDEKEIKENEINGEKEGEEQEKIEESETEKENTLTKDSTKNIEYEDVFFYDLIDNLDYYNGKNIRTVIQVFSCYEDEDGDYIISQYPDYDLTENYENLTIYPDNYSEYEYEEYITVKGMFIKENGDRNLIDAHIEEYGENSKREWDENLIAFNERREEKLKMEKETFMNEAETPNYDDLLRYPDSYKNIKIKVNVKVVRVEPDGMIFDGDIEGTMGGETVALYDGRMTKEPKLREGDNITIYGYGNGTTTVKVQDVSGLIPKTVDKYDIPSIDMRYIEFN